ncbi:MAG TPA: efflux RND transporter permease subunit [Leptospiraceae bacterium]|nr:efflux RND transporter permease subunit [Leptospiraceae bacterium]HMW04777.1 efflux RND transporter permease subunit [Leptospiraceae bacterium]HMX32794.1 efflux RND transporter permease subunit [Leptospiraceae bacterium]HMY33049.1 efflux RND transporter permease subunit [Leptospiraceae bacterium]HMZ65530.1 efflux RND transporter permease subunit [Leptospiraceae bacterium]
MRKVIEYFLSKSLLLNLLTVLIILVGSYKALTMNREAFPNINFDIVTVTTIYPGASPAEVEKLVTKPIEDSIKSVDGIKEYRSASIENRSGIVITIDPNAPDTQKVVDDIKSAVDRTEDLPEDSKKPIVQEVTSSRNPVIEINVGVKADASGKPVLTEKQFKEKAKQLEDLLLDVPEVGRVVRRGYREAEMHVDINPLALDRISLSTNQIIMALKGKNVNFPGGTIADAGREAIVRTVGEFDTESEIEKVFIRSNDAGRSIILKDVAKVTEDFEDKQYIEKVNGLYSIVLVVVKKERGDAIKLVDKVKKVVTDYGATQSDYITLSYVNDLSKYIRRRLDVLVSNGLQGFVLVVISLFFFLGWRVALMVALGLPLAMALTFIILDYMGMTLNLISMLGLIIVVGMLVDDAIVISENIYRYLEEGVEPYEACIRGTIEVIAPVTATITTTIAAFGPMLFVTGIFGKFIYSIPMVVIIALSSSLFEAFFILPSHIYDVNKHGIKKGEIKEEGHWFVKVRERFYRPSLSWALKHKGLTVLILVTVFAFCIGLNAAFGKFKLFPGGIEVFIVKISAETGLTLEETEKFARAVEREIALLPQYQEKKANGFVERIQYFFHSLGLVIQPKFHTGEVENYVTRVGIIQKDVNDPFTKRGKNFAQVVVYLTPDAERKRSTEQIINYVRKRTEWLMNEKALAVAKQKELARRNAEKKKNKPSDEENIPIEIPEEFKELKGKLVSLDLEAIQGGPPVGKPVAIEIRGDDFTTLKKIAQDFKDVMGQVEGVIDIGDDFNDGKDEIRLTIDEALAAQAGVSVQQIALAVNTAYQGTVATTIKRADEEVDVRVRFPENFRTSIRSLDKIFVNNNMGNLIPISRMTKYEKVPGLASINHLDGKRLLTATANLDETKTTSMKANQEIKKLADAAKIMDKYPGYRIRYGGENKDTEESLASLGRSFMIAFFIIFIILVSLFRSFVQPLIVASAIPFSFIGVIIAFVTHGQYFSFLSFIGIVGLSGIVVNDSIVLVDFANQLRSQRPDMSSYDILLETGCVRLRPVILTTVTTVLGILPTAYGIGGSDPFLMPMALAIGWGLAFATFLTLIIVPVFYKIVMDFQIWFSDKFFRKDIKTLAQEQA